MSLWPLLVAFGCGPSTLAEVLSDASALDPAEAEATRALLAAAGVPAAAVTLGEQGDTRATVTEGHIRTLTLRGAQLRHLVALDPFVGLERLDLSKNPLTDLSGIGSNATLRELSVRDSPLTDGGDLRGLTALLLVYLSGGQLRSPAQLQLPPTVLELDLSQNPLNDFQGFSGMPLLTGLYLRGTSATSTAGLGALPLLERLFLDQSPITTLSGLSGLSRLKYLSVTGCPLVDVSALDRLSVAKVVGVEVAVASPDREAPAGVAPLAVTPTTSGGPTSIEALPPGSGYTTLSRQSCTDVGNRTKCEGRMGTLSGAVTPSINLRQELVTVSVTVESGAVRLTLGTVDFSGSADPLLATVPAPPTRYQAVTATPGHPVRLYGRVWAPEGRKTLVLEAVGGNARGVEWKVE